MIMRDTPANRVLAKFYSWPVEKLEVKDRKLKVISVKIQFPDRRGDPRARKHYESYCPRTPELKNEHFSRQRWIKQQIQLLGFELYSPVTHTKEYEYPITFKQEHPHHDLTHTA